MDSPQNHIWGPQLWIILHSATERIGSASLKRLPQEESRIWLNLLSSLRYTLPCPLCKKHYTEYFNRTPIRIFNRDSIRSWLYTLHCQINDRTGKINTISIENLSELYSKPFKFTHHYGIVFQQMNQALRLGWCNRTDLQRSIRFFQELKQFYDFF
jgi:hypothetical protein